MNKYQILIEEVDNSYRVLQLKILYEKYIKKLIKLHTELLTENLDLKKSVSELETSKRFKKDYVKILAAVMSQKNTFIEFMKLFSEDGIFLINKLIWTEIISIVEIEEKFNIQVLNPSKKDKWNEIRYDRTKDDFQILCTENFNDYHESNACFTFPYKIREILSEYVAKPDRYYLKPTNEFKSDYVYENNYDILQEFPLLYSYYLNGAIKVKQAGEVSISTANKLRKNLAIKEFYPEDNKKFRATRSHLLATFFSEINIKPQGDDTHKIIKRIFHDYSTSYFDSLRHFLINLKGIAYVSHTRQDIKILWELLKVLKLKEWYSLQDIIEYILLRNPNFIPVRKYDASRYLYYLIDDGVYKYKKFISKGIYNKYIIEPILKSGLALFASFGLIDIAYDKFDNSKLFFSMFDKLKYVRLNPLGEYVCGLKDDFKPPKQTNELEFNLSNTELIIQIEGDLELAKTKLQNIADINKNNVFIVTYDSFLKNCKDDDDIFTKIEIFENIIIKPLPPNWNVFFKEIVRKFSPFKEIGIAKIFDIKKDAELINYLKKDNILEKTVSFIDDYKIVIEKANVSKVKRRLKKFGYLL